MILNSPHLLRTPDDHWFWTEPRRITTPRVLRTKSAAPEWTPYDKLTPTGQKRLLNRLRSRHDEPLSTTDLIYVANRPPLHAAKRVRRNHPRALLPNIGPHTPRTAIFLAYYGFDYRDPNAPATLGGKRGASGLRHLCTAHYVNPDNPTDIRRCVNPLHQLPLNPSFWTDNNIQDPNPEATALLPPPPPPRLLQDMTTELPSFAEDVLALIAATFPNRHSLPLTNQQDFINAILHALQPDNPEITSQAVHDAFDFARKHRRETPPTAWLDIMR